MMTGWKTYLGAAAFMLLAVYNVLEGQYEEAVKNFALAMGLIGIGHKIEKAIGGLK